jgi:hypothetical protein
MEIDSVLFDKKLAYQIQQYIKLIHMYTNAKNIPVEIIPVESGKRG